MAEERVDVGLVRPRSGWACFPSGWCSQALAWHFPLVVAGHRKCFCSVMCSSLLLSSPPCSNPVAFSLFPLTSGLLHLSLIESTLNSLPRETYYGERMEIKKEGEVKRKERKRKLYSWLLPGRCGHFLWSVRARKVPQGELVKLAHLQIGNLRMKKASVFFKVTQSPRAEIRLMLDYVDILFFLKLLPVSICESSWKRWILWCMPSGEFLCPPSRLH